jgi:acetyl esterase/lipase
MRAQSIGLGLVLLLGLAACGGSETPTGGTTSSGSGAGGSTTSSSTGTGGAPPSEVMCDGSTVYAVPEDPAARGPWAVGARTGTLGGLKTEIWYPAAWGSEAGKTKARYDIREHLPDADQSKIPDADNPWQDCDCYRDLPLDEAHGPYPVVYFIHGTAGFRTQSLTFMTHWASRGFVVVAADHPGMELKDILVLNFNNQQAAQGTMLLDDLAKLSGDAAFLNGHVDLTRLAAAGHSAGGGAIAGYGDRAKVLIPMAAGGSTAAAALVSTLVMGAKDDGVVAYTNQQNGYQSSPKKKRLVGLSNSGHLAFSDLCFIGRDKGGLLQIAQDHGITVNPLIAQLAQDGCKTGQLPPEKAWPIVNFATTAALEETLACGAGSAAKLTQIQMTYPDVGDYLEDL